MMETLMGISAGVISIMLGVIGAIVSLAPPTTTTSKRRVAVVFCALSLAAIFSTICDKRNSSTHEREMADHLQKLKDSSTAVGEQNRQLLEANAELRQKVNELLAKPGPEDVAMAQTLRRDIEEHLSRISSFLVARRKELTEITAGTSTGPAYERTVEAFGQQTASTYIADYYPRTRELLTQAMHRHIIPAHSLDVDDRWVLAGLLPGIDDLNSAVKALPR